MNSIGRTVRQPLRAFQIIQRSRRLTSSFLVAIWLLVIVFAGLGYFISGDQTQLVRVKFFSYALISLQKVNDLLLMDEILPSPNSFIFKGRYRKGLLVQGSAALSVMQANRSLLSSVEDRDLQAVLLSYTLLEKGIHLHWREPELFDLNRRIVPRLTALLFAVSQKRDILSRRIDRMLFFRMALLLLSFGGGLIFLLVRLVRNRRVSRQNRFYRALSRINRLILSLPDQESLLQNTCRIIVDEAHVRTVWIGNHNPVSGSGRWVAYDGTVTEELIRRPLSDDPSVHSGQGIWGHTIRSREVVVWNDPMTSLPEGYLRDLYRANGIRSAAGFPLMEGETLYGALVVQSDEPDYFDPDLIELISALVENLSFVLKNWARESARREAEERLTTLIETLPEVIIFKDGEGRWKVVNPAGLRLFKLEGRTDWVNKTDRELGLLQPELATVYEGCTLSDNAVWKLGAPSNGIETMNNAEGNPVILDVTKLPLFNPDGTRKGLVISAQDITERKRNENRIEHMASHDALTDLPNRRVFLDRIAQTILRSGRSRERFAVGILDLDGFKGVNDRLGHQKGDKLLVQVAKRLGALLRKTDTMARLGGDEFGLLLVDLDEGVVSQDLFTKIVQSLLNPFDVGKKSEEMVRISGSLGLTLYPPDRGDADSLIAHADLALYRAKDRGRNGWAVFEREMEESLLDQHRILTEFDLALGNEELCFYYQPQVNMETGQVIGVEALIRWNHPVHGFLTPNAFIEVVEKSDLIIPLGRWVLNTAMVQQKAWEQEDLNLRISVNIGARHFLSDGFIETLSEILSRHERSEHLMIEIEVTETEALRDLEKARKTIDRCHALGVSISLDDFGTGQTSLTSLQQLDIKEVKIDIGFIHRMMESQKDLAIVSSLSVAARMMLINVLAEGVETEEEGETLLQMGIEVAQGYAIARPMPPSMIPVWSKGWRTFESWKQQERKKRGGYQDDTLLMVRQATKIFLKGILLGLDTPGIIKEEWTDPLKCVPGQWIERAGRSRYGGTPQFDAVERVHDTLHVLVGEALSARDNDDRETLKRLKSELTETSLSLREALQKLSD